MLKYNETKSNFWKSIVLRLVALFALQKINFNLRSDVV